MGFLEKVKERGSENPSNVEVTTTDKPPKYEQTEPSPPVPGIPPLSLRTSAGSSTNTSVTPDSCVAHLKFLAALAELRDSVGTTDGLFGIYDLEADKFQYSLNEVRARIREKRWAVYTARAVKRFTVWWERCVPRCGYRPRQDAVSDPEYHDVIAPKTQVSWSKDAMPPLDVMMVFHSYMLNPRSFLEDCIRFAKMNLWASGFPWEIVNDCINEQSMEYNAGEAAVASFEEKTGCFWDNLHDPPDTLVDCPRCGQSTAVPWTAGVINTNLDKAFEDFHGFADKGFKALCPRCSFTIDHERLKLLKFRNDVQALLVQKLPMPGTLFNLYGVPEPVRNPDQNRLLFPNRLVGFLGNHLLRFTDARLNECEKIQDLARDLSKKIKDKLVLRGAKGVVMSATILPGEKISVRRMMSHYWDNHSPFALDLVGAVIRQGSFVQKMDSIDWLHSPTVMATMNRLIQKYRYFFRIMASNPRRMAVPTLDVDLAWHTHQLSPLRYYNYSTSQTFNLSGRSIFIDHDDKVEEVRLANGFEWTSKQYTKVTGGDIYSECTCWYCEAIRVPDLYGIGSLLRSSTTRAREAAANLHGQSGVSSDPERNPHISSHNAIRAPSTVDFYSQMRDVKAAELRSNYTKACRRAEKRKSKNGNGSNSNNEEKDKNRNSKDDMYTFPIIWGFPIYVPCYAPYMCDPGVHCDAYVGNPACMNSSPGSEGGCIAGTCSATVTAGACASLGAAGCGTGTGNCGALGGCGSGGGFGCGGGGGGGCGGGGGGGGC